MAEMTAREAVRLIDELLKFGHMPFPYKFTAILTLIQQQAQTIDHQNLQIAKLQEDLIKAISEKERKINLDTEHGVSRGTIQNIHEGRNWKHV